MSIEAPADIVWHVSSRCDSGQCVGVARRGQTVLVTNTSTPEGPVSEFTIGEWHQFLAGVKLGDFDAIA
jgi:hypothetical protein